MYGSARLAGGHRLAAPPGGHRPLWATALAAVCGASAVVAVVGAQSSRGVRAWTSNPARAVQTRLATPLGSRSGQVRASVAFEDVWPRPAPAVNAIRSAAPAPAAAAPPQPALPALLAPAVLLVAGAAAWLHRRTAAARPPAALPSWSLAAVAGRGAFHRPGRPTAGGRCARLRSTAVADAPANPLLQQAGLPKFRSIDAAHVQPAVEAILEALRQSFQELEATAATVAPPDAYGKVVEKLELIGDPLSYAWGVVGHLMGVKNSDALRAAHTAMQPAVIQTMQAMGQSRPVYRVLEALRADAAVWDRLESAQQRIVEASLRQMRHSGVGLEGAALERFNQIALELAELSTKFSNNVLDSTKAYSLLLTKKEEVRGLPPTALALAAQTAVSKGHAGATPENGPWVLTLDMPSYLPAMQFLEDRGLREKLMRVNVTRASSGEFDNTPLITRILTLRQERARLLGYKTHAEYSLASKMAESVEEVDALTELLRNASYEPAKRELAAVEAFARERGFTGEFAPWDLPFWAERQKEALYAFTQEELRPYFALPNVLAGLFQLCERIFDVTIVQADGEAEVWHPDVRFFKILDKGAHIASFYLDPYSRPEDKRGGAWMGTCLGASKVLHRKPVAYLTCNGSPPVGDVPSLMTFAEVETLFHETGHGLQHMLTTVQDGEAAGINNVEWDAVELPSQFMENWCYDRPTLYGFAKHYATGEPLPEALYEKLKAQKNYNAGLQILRQLLFGQVDLELHHRYDPTDLAAKTPFDVMRAMSERYTVLPPLPEDRFLCTFGHIFAGGYSAGYYSYKWAEVMSADAFAAFEEAGLDNEEAVRRVGRRFRDTVLALGGSKHPRDVYHEFRGRDPSPEALLRHSGLAE